MGETAESAGESRVQLRNYALVLASIVASFVFLGAAPAEDWAAFLAVVLQSVTLLLALWVSGASPILMRVALVAVVFALFGAAGLLFGAGATRVERSAAGGSLMLHGLIVAAVPFAIGRGLVRELRERTRITAPTLLGALCIYLLIGMFFSADLRRRGRSRVGALLRPRGDRDVSRISLLQLRHADDARVRRPLASRAARSHARGDRGACRPDLSRDRYRARRRHSRSHALARQPRQRRQINVTGP